MEPKERSKKNKMEKAKPAAERKKAKKAGQKGQIPAGKAAETVKSELAQTDERLHMMPGLLGNLPQGICFFNKEDIVEYCNDSFSAITGLSEDALKGKKLRKNQLWGGRQQEDEFKELFQQVRESGEPLLFKRQVIASGSDDDRTWNLSLIPQKDGTGSYDGMELIIEDVTGRRPTPDESLSSALYAVAVSHKETQPLLEGIASIFKDHCGCAAARITMVDSMHGRHYKADTDNRMGLWESDESLSPDEIDSIFKTAESLDEEYRTAGGSIFLRNVRESGSKLTGVLKDIVINTSNSYGFTSMAFIPVNNEGWIRGFIQIANTREEIGYDSIMLLENACNQLQVILENVGIRDEMRLEREELIKQMNDRNAHLETMNEHLKLEVSEREKAREEMRVQRDLALALNKIDELDEALDICLDSALKVSGMDCGGIYLWDEAGKELVLACHKGVSTDFMEIIRRCEGDWMGGGANPSGEPRYIDVSEMEGQFAGDIKAEGIKVIGSIPVIHENDSVAVMIIASHEAGEISCNGRNAVEAIAVEMGAVLIRIQHSKSYMESQEKYKTLFDRTSNPILVVDEKGNYIDANDAALAFLECTREELLAMNIKDTLPPYLDDEWLANYRAVLQTSATVERDYYVWGKIKVLELTITPLVLGSRKVTFSIGKDITEKKRMENELKQSEERYRNHFNNVSDVVYSIDKNLKIIDISPSVEKKLGYRPDEIIGKSVEELVFLEPHSLEKALSDSMRIFEGEVVEPTEYRFKTKNGTIVYAEISGAPLYRGGEIVGLISVARDITDRKKAEEEIRASQQRYQSLACYNQKLSEIFSLLIEAPSYQELIKRVAESLKDLTGALGVGVTRYEKHSRVLRVELICADDAFVNQGEVMLGKSVKDLEIDLTEEMESQMLDKILYRARDTGNLMFGESAVQQQREIMEAMGIFGVVGLSLNYGNELAGTVFALLPAGVLEIPDDVLKSFAYMAGLAVFKKTGEEELIRSEAKFRNIVEASPDPIWEIDESGVFTYISSQILNILGYEPEEVLGKPFLSIIRPDKVDDVSKKFIEAQQADVLYTAQVETVAKNGCDVMMEIRAAQIRDRDGKLTGFRGTGRDITDRIMHEKALLESEEKYRSVVEGANEGIFVLQDGQLKYANAPLLNLSGYTLDELQTIIGDDPLNTLIHPDDLQMVEQQYANRMRGEASPDRQEVRWIVKDGSINWASISVASFMWEGKPAILGFVTDITERKNIEKSLAASEEKFRTILEDMEEFYYEIDPQGNYTYVNEAAERIFGYSAEELIGMNYKNYVPADQYSRRVELFGGVFRTGIPVFTEPLESIKKDGSHIITESSILPLRNDKGEIVGLRGIGRDCTARIKAEQELHTRALLLDSAYDSIIAYEPDGKIVYANQSACNSRGYSREEILQLNIRQLVPEDSLSKMEERLDAISRQGELIFEGLHIKKDLTVFPVEAYTRLIEINGVKTVISVFRDQTLRKEAERILRESEEKYKSVVDNAGEAIYIAQGDKLVYVNPKAVELTGYSEQEILAKPFTELIHPDDREMVGRRYTARLNGDAVPDYYTFRIICKDGTVKSIGLHATRIIWEGQPATLNFSSDETEKLKAEQALKESEERYRLLAENSMDIIITTDMDLKATYISPSVRYMIGMTAEEVLNLCREGKLNAGALGLAEVDAERALEGMKNLIQDPSRAQVFELEFRHPDGFANWAEVKMSIMYDKSRKAAGILGVIRDITQQKKMTERIIRSDRLASLGEMAAGLAHEVNNPLTAVMGFSYLALQNPALPAEIKNDINSICSEGKRAADVIKNFLLFARGHKPERQAVFINDIIESTLRLRNSQLAGENIKVLLNLAEDLPAINGDISQLQQVFMNILLNAEYFMYKANQKGTISITTKYENGVIKISVTDDGPGIAQDKLSRVFDPFYTTKQVGEGTGLGLSICHGIVSEHGGSIYAESSPEEGATFIVELPITR